MNNLRNIVLLAAVTALTACGGSSTGGGGPSFAGLAAQGDAIVERNVSLFENLSYTNLATLPTTGSTRYTGTAGYIVDPTGNEELNSFSEAAYLSNVAMTLNFGNNRVNGTASNFRSATPGETLTGRLNMTGTLDRNTNLDFFYGVNGNVTGNLQSSVVGAITVDGEVYADLFGANRQVMAGGIEATADSNSGRSTLVGEFVLER